VSEPTAGRRVDADPNHSADYPFPRLKAGEYGMDVDGLWYCVPPGTDLLGCLGDGESHHKVTEYGDGTITVSPSILVGSGEKSWHGYLERGIWREC
jgi:hypothetical protein